MTSPVRIQRAAATLQKGGKRFRHGISCAGGCQRKRSDRQERPERVGLKNMTSGRILRSALTNRPCLAARAGCHSLESPGGQFDLQREGQPSTHQPSTVSTDSSIVRAEVVEQTSVCSRDRGEWRVRSRKSRASRSAQISRLAEIPFEINWLVPAFLAALQRWPLKTPFRRRPGRSPCSMSRPSATRPGRPE